VATVTLRPIGVVDEARRRALEAAVAGHRTLEHVVRWVAAEDLVLADVVTMDEYTHDVLVASKDGLVLVFDKT
jgi:hypothetical protein